MRRRLTFGRKSRRSALPALLALLAILVGALMPAAAMAASARSGVEVRICSAAGAGSVVIDAAGKAHKAFLGLPCQDCLAITLAATATPPPSLPSRSESFIAGWAASTTQDDISDARLAPRPPGQGPPTRTG